MSFLFWFVMTQILVVLAYILCTALQTNLSFSAKLRLHYASLASVLAILILQFFIPTPSPFKPIERYFNQGIAKARAITLDVSPQLLRLDQSSFSRLPLSSPALPVFPIGAVMIFLTFASLKIKKDLKQLKQIEAAAFASGALDT